MAIPFNLPTRQETEDNYEIMDQLLEQLYEIVRQIILRRRRSRGADNRTGIPAPEPRNRDTQTRDGGGGGGNEAGRSDPSVNGNQEQGIGNDAMRRIPALPDIVPITDIRAAAPSDAPVPPPRRGTPEGGVRPRPRRPPRRPRRRTSSCCCNEKKQGVPNDDRTTENWKEVGKDLRKIADEFCTSSRLEGEGTQTAPHLHNKKKEEGLLSLLLPPRLGGSMWTAVIILVGWRFLASSGW
ncbi:uncharacterized protein LOC110833352 isoform X2 [Zootermopsis nevadensis]|nr:uncharacterized protein LOC110833352 isoform X2 [Zootermopsis nevadensis]